MADNIEEVINERGLEALNRYYSKYRAIVVDNIDPDNMGKLAVSVPSIGMGFSVIAYPCNQDGATASGFKWLIPKKGSVVFVEFQNGDPMYPLWSYHGWAKFEQPSELNGNDVLGFVTPHGHVFTLNDSTGELTLSIKDQTDETKEITNIHATSEAVSITTSTQLNIKGEKILMMDGKVGTTLTDKLLIRLNLLERDYNLLKKALAASASQIMVLAPTYSAVQAWSATSIVETKLTDIENKQILQ